MLGAQRLQLPAVILPRLGQLCVERLLRLEKTVALLRDGLHLLAVPGKRLLELRAEIVANFRESSPLLCQRVDLFLRIILGLRELRAELSALLCQIIPLLGESLDSA